MATFGRTTYAETGQWTPYLYMQKHFLPMRGLVSSISCYEKSGFQITEYMRYSIYSDNNGTPNLLLAKTDKILTSSQSFAWTTLNLLNPIILEEGNYWLVVAVDGIHYFGQTWGDFPFYYAGDGSYAEFPPNSFSEMVNTYSYPYVNFAIYATYTPAPLFKLGEQIFYK